METDAVRLLSRLGIPAAWSGQPPRWEDTRTDSATLAWPDEAEIARACRRLALDDDDLQAGLGIRRRLQTDPDLDHLGRYIRWRTFGPEPVCDWGLPDLSPHLGQDSGAFYLLLALTFPAELDRRHRAWGHPAEVTQDTATRIQGFSGNHRRATGRPGVLHSEFGWLANFLLSPYVRLGRFEYQLNRWQGPVEAWREASGRWLLLAMDGLAIDEDGLQALPGEAVWTTTRTQTNGSLTAHPVAGNGRIRSAAVTIDTARWRRVAGPGDDMLDIHIPPGGGMSMAAVEDSLRQVGPFFAKHHPDRPWQAVVCSTWFLDPRLPGILGASSNPAQFQRSVALFPTGPYPHGLWFVFMQPTETPTAQLRRDTGMQRAIAEALQAGLRWHGGGCLLLPDDLAELQSDHHRRMFDVLIAELTGDG